MNYGESEAKVTAFFKSTGLDFAALLDPNQEAPKAWRVRVLPASFLVGRDGRVRYSVIGEIDWASDEALKTVARLCRRRTATRRFGPNATSSGPSRRALTL